MTSGGFTMMASGGQGGSDRRLKKDIQHLGTSNDQRIPIYTFRYTDEAVKELGPQYGGGRRFMGTIAQDLLAMGRSDAVQQVAPSSSSHLLPMDSYYVVDYTKLDVEFVEVSAGMPLRLARRRL